MAFNTESEEVQTASGWLSIDLSSVNKQLLGIFYKDYLTNLMLLINCLNVDTWIAGSVFLLSLILSPIYLSYPWNKRENFCERRSEELRLLRRVLHGDDIEELQRLDGGIAGNEGFI